MLFFIQQQWKMMQLNWDCNSIMSRQVSFHMYAMQPGFACRRKRPLPGLSVYWISPQKLLQTSMRQKASVTWVSPRCFPPPQTPAAHLPPAFPELLLLPAQPLQPSQQKRGGISWHMPSPRSPSFLGCWALTDMALMLQIRGLACL